MPKGMEVFDADEHLSYSGSEEGNSTGTGARVKGQKNSGTQRYTGHANGPKKVASQRPQSKYYMYDTGKGFKQKLALEDLTDDEDFLTTDENLKNVRTPRGKGKK